MPEPDATDRSPRVSEAGAAAMSPVTLPAGFTCPKCDYDLGGASVQVCSECGRGIERGDLVSFRKRSRADGMLRKTSARFLKMLVTLPLLMSGVALLILQEFRAAAVAAGVSLFMFGVSWGLGASAALLAPARERAAIRVAWMVAMPWMHGPWLVLPVFAVVEIGLALLVVGRTRGAPMPAFGSMLVLLPCMAIWVIVTAVFLVRAMRVFMGGLREFGLVRRNWYPLLVAAIFVLGACAALFGLVGFAAIADALESGW